ncbi:hypothetical protein AAFN86_14770 [Roseomonas sp. CAU 1739]|uniref:hypothetical protein n=1 Tax=Roseomonas sp. CAU 1739 TaxID=3140364 RepID=UPI00325B721B
MRSIAPAALALMLAALPARAQPALEACADEARPPAARVGTCTMALRLSLPPSARARALTARADAQFTLALQRSETQRAADPEGSLPPAALDPALADIGEAISLGAGGEALLLRATLRLWRGDLSPAARRSVLRGDNEAVIRDLTAAIAADPGNWELHAMRGANRSMSGLPGADADFAEARRLLAAARR